MCEQNHRKRYPSDLTDAQWELLAHAHSRGLTQHHPADHRATGNRQWHPLRATNRLFVETDAPRPAQRQDGVPLFPSLETGWDLGTGHDPLAQADASGDGAGGRTQRRHHRQPIDQNQSRARYRAWRAMPGKKIWGRKRHLLVDTQGFVLAVRVLAASLSDREGAKALLAEHQGSFPRISHLFADHGSTGPLTEWIKALLGWDTEIVPKATNDSHQHWVLQDGQPILLKKPKGGFQVQRKRWVVERTFAWLSRFRRLARDYEGLPGSSEAFIQVATVRLLLKRLAPFPY
jgi:transposase